MIVSYLHNFIFIKTKKTGGSSIEMTLAPHCGPGDIITPLGNQAELARGNGEPLCRNFADDPGWEEELRTIIKGKRPQARRKAFEKEHKPKFFNHMPARQIKARVAPEFWDRAVKITSERHPYEKAVSLAYFTFKTGSSFDAHLDSIVRKRGYVGYPLYTIGEEVVVDEFIRLETLHDDMRRVAAKLGLPIPDEMARAKSRTRLDPRPAREILSDVQKEIVYATCKKEFDLLGYER